MPPDDARLQRARIALEGLSIGDSLGAFFELSSGAPSYFMRERKTPEAVWHYTDDTLMALSIYAILRRYGEINQDELATHFARHFDGQRGYGMGARHLMNKIRQGVHWQEAAKNLFGGQGSYGNGGAMRVAPIGAYFADDMDAAIENARLSAQITHSHSEGVAGAIAVAAATAIAYRIRGEKITRREFIGVVAPHVPPSEVRGGLKTARDLPENTTTAEAVAALGNGSRVTAQDSVPFAVWCAAAYLDDFREAIWQVIGAGGDTDTIGAMVGGIIATYNGTAGIPAEWVAQREPLPTWAFEDEIDQ